MINEEEKLSNIINSKLSEDEFPFDEENWEKAEELIDDLRKNKKRRRWALIFFIGLISGVAVMLPFISKMKNENEKTKTEINTRFVQKNKNAIIAENNSKVGSQQKAANVPAQKTEISQNNAAIPYAEIFTTEIKTKQIKGLEKENFKNPAIKEGNNHTATFVTNSNAPKEEKTVPIVSTTAPGEIKKEKAQENKTNEENSVSIIFVKPKEVKEEKLKENEPIQNITVLVLPNQEPVSKTEPGKEEPSANNGIQNVPDSAQKTNAVPFVNNPDSAVKKTDSTGSNKYNTTSESEKEKAVLKNIFSIEVGTSFIAGWNYNDTIEGRGFNPIAGFGFTHVFNPKWSVKTGLHYNSIGHLSSSMYTAHHVNYDFGYNSTDTAITTKRVHFITIPVQLQYNLNAKNYIGAGISVSYLITSSGTITTYNQTAFTIANKQEVSQTGFSKGFNTWNASVMALYGRRLSGRLSVNLVTYYGLMDLKDNSFFSKQKFERDMGVKILFSFTIFK